MHRKEVELIASVLKSRLEAWESIDTMSDAINAAAVAATEIVARDMARAFKHENPSFPADKFLAACGIKNP